MSKDVLGQSHPPNCYYCSKKGFINKDEYERHVVITHPLLPGYPNEGDIKLYNLKPQGMDRWEKPLSEKEAEEILTAYIPIKERLKYYKQQQKEHERNPTKNIWRT